jgi:hypothetical protein
VVVVLVFLAEQQAHLRLAQTQLLRDLQTQEALVVVLQQEVQDQQEAEET